VHLIDRVKQLFRGDRPRVLARMSNVDSWDLVLTSGGHWLALAGDDTIRVVDLRGWSEKCNLSRGTSPTPHWVAFSPNGKLLIALLGESFAAFETERWSRVFSAECGKVAWPPVFAPDSSAIAFNVQEVGEGRSEVRPLQTRLWALPEWSEVAPITDGSEVRAILPVRRGIICAAGDSITARGWESRQVRLEARRVGSAGVGAQEVFLDPSGRYLAFQGSRPCIDGRSAHALEGIVSVWDLASDMILWTTRGVFPWDVSRTGRCPFSANGESLVIESGGFAVYDVATGVGRPGVRPPLLGIYDSCVISPDGRWLAVATSAGLALYRAATGELMRLSYNYFFEPLLLDNQPPPHHLSLTDDGRLILVYVHFSRGTVHAREWRLP